MLSVVVSSVVILTVVAPKNNHKMFVKHIAIPALKVLQIKMLYNFFLGIINNLANKLERFTLASTSTLV
jgi:hypothetical protein